MGESIHTNCHLGTLKAFTIIIKQKLFFINWVVFNL